MSDIIQKIQLKRGTQNILELVLKDSNRPASGEPIYELDTGRLKIGDGIHDYADLAYFGSIASTQKLVYNNIFEFPTVGDENTLYIVNNGNSYVWDAQKKRYKVLFLDNRQFYELILNDDGEIIGAERQIDAGSATADYNIENFTYTK